MDNSTLWWVIAGVAIVAELATGTFYLLMLALGFVAAALAAMAGQGFTVQLLSAAIVGGGAVAWWHWRQPAPHRGADLDKNTLMDIGERLDIPAWDTHGLARVNYRGAEWDARLAPGEAACSGAFEIIAIEHNQLVLRHVG